MRFCEIINELSGVEEYRRAKVDSLTSLDAYMTELGFQSLSGGEFSRVFERPGVADQIVKVYNDECYDRFIAYCQANPGNPHLPKFRGRGVRIDNRARMIRMERLTPIEDSVYAREISPLVKMVKANDPNVIWDIAEEDKALVATIRELVGNSSSVSTVKPGGCWFDLHSGNVMKRGDTYVIIDPFAPDREGWASTAR